MSGSQIGSAVGFVGGFFLPGGPAVWSTIGGAIGGWVSPTQVNGPRIGDTAQQSSAEGIPIAWILGTAGWVQGNIVDKSEVREIKKTDDGKGGGQEVNTYEAHQDYCILICESSEHRESLMAGVLIVRVDGKIVYDMRPNAKFAAENSKFLKRHTFYDGNEAQLPDPTMEALPHNGVGNTPYYRGVYTMVARDINITEYGTRIPTYEFVMVGQGESVTSATVEYVPPIYGEFVDSDWPLASPEKSYRYVGTRYPITGPTEEFAADSIGEIIAHFSTGAHSYGGAPSQYIGYSASTGHPQSFGDFGINRAVQQPSVVKSKSLTLVYQNNAPAEYLDASASASSTCPLLPTQSDLELKYADKNGTLIGKFTRDEWGGAGPGHLHQYVDCSPGGIISGMPALYISVFRSVEPPEPVYGDPCEIGVPTILPDSPDFTIDCLGVIRPKFTYTEIDNFDIRALQGEVVEWIGGLPSLVKRTVGPIMHIGDARNTQAFWESAFAEAVASGQIEDTGQVWPTDYPAMTVNAYRASRIETSVQKGALGVDSAIARICRRGGLSLDDLDIAEMDQLLEGYPILQPYNGVECLRPLMTAFTSFGSEYDGRLRFHKHGATVEVVVDPEDFIEGSDETEKSAREQAIEYPRLISVTAIDPTQDYTARPQVERRITPDVRAIGEESMQVPIVMQPDHQRQLAAIGMKVGWARQQGRVEFSVPYAAAGAYLKMVPGKPFGLEGKRYIVETLRLEDGEIHIEGAYDRQSAYTSNVTATPALPPTAPPSNIGGVTLFAAMNLPRLRSKDNSPGMYIAVAGLLDGWPGALIQMSVDDGASWSTAIPSATQASVLGYLEAPIGPSPDEILSVAVHGGELNSISEASFASGGNPVAVLTNEVAEILQFMTAAEAADGQYELTQLGRGRLGTVPAGHSQGDKFTSLDSVYFLPLDISLAGQKIKFRPVTFGTSAEASAIYEATFNPQFTGAQVTELYVNEAGEVYVNEAGSIYYRIIN